MNEANAWILGKLSMKQRILYKKIGKSCDKINAMAEKKCRSVESEYQRISDATSQKSLHETSRSSPSSPKCKNKNKNQQGNPKKKVSTKQRKTFSRLFQLLIIFRFIPTAMAKTTYFTRCTIQQIHYPLHLDALALTLPPRETPPARTKLWWLLLIGQY